MASKKLRLRPAGKGLVLAALSDGMPVMRRLVEAYTGTDRKTYIKLDGEITPLLPCHMFLSGN